MAALQVDINLITLVLGSMMICIGSVYGVHVYARYEIIAGEAVDPAAAALDCLRYVRTSSSDGRRNHLYRFCCVVAH